MPRALPYNKLIDLHERGNPAFVAGTVSNGRLDDLTFIAASDDDGVIIETEHEGIRFHDAMHLAALSVQSSPHRHQGQFPARRRAAMAHSTEHARPRPLARGGIAANAGAFFQQLRKSPPRMRGTGPPARPIALVHRRLVDPLQLVQRYLPPPLPRRYNVKRLACDCFTCVRPSFLSLSHCGFHSRRA